MKVRPKTINSLKKTGSKLLDNGFGIFFFFGTKSKGNKIQHRHNEMSHNDKKWEVKDRMKSNNNLTRVSRGKKSENEENEREPIIE